MHWPEAEVGEAVPRYVRDDLWPEATVTWAQHPLYRRLSPVEPLPQRSANAPLSGRADLPLVEMREQEVERERMPGAIPVAREDHVGPSSHADRCIGIALQLELPPRDCSDENALVPRPRERANGEEVRPGTQPPNALIRRRPVVELQERRHRPAHHSLN